MSLNPKFVLMPSLQQVIFDKTLDTFLSDGIVSFFEDENRTVPKTVYTLTGTGPGSYQYVSLGSVLTLSGIGSFVDSSGGNIIPYLYPYEGLPTDPEPSTIVELYYITVYSSTGVFQFDISAWPNIIGNATPINEADTTDNLIANPEFSQILFYSGATQGSPFSFTTTGTNIETKIAPDWSVITTGNGSFGVYQQVISDNTAPGNPTFALGITTSGYSTPVILRQRWFTPRIFSGGLVSGTFIVESMDGGSYTVSLNYTPSLTGTIQQICTGTTLSSGFTLIANTNLVLITNPGGGTGYVDITIVIPVGAPLQISCVQLCGVSGTGESVAYLQQTPAREADHLFHYWQDKLNFKPIPSYLTAWDFPLNPAQFNGPSVGSQALGANTSYYAWDQTIVFQSVTNSINISRVSDIGYLQLAATANTQMAIIQYLTGSQIQDILVQALSAVSSYVRMSSTVAQAMSVSLWWTANNSLPSIGSAASFVAGLDANGHPNSVVAGWNEIKIPNNNGLFTTPGSLSLADFSISGFTDPMAYHTAKFFAIVVGSSQVLNGNVLNFGSVSLVPGLIPTIPAPQSADEVLRECQYYYETSYASVADFNATPNNNALWMPQTMISTGSTNILYASPGSVQYKVLKRANPNLTVYSLAKTNGSVSSLLWWDNSGTVTQIGPHDKSLSLWTNSVAANSFFITPNSRSALESQSTLGTTTFGSGSIAFHWVVDARLGVV